MSFSSAFFAGAPWTSGAGAKETFLLTLLEDETEETPGLPVLLGGGVVNLSLFASSFFAAFFKLLALGLRPEPGPAWTWIEHGGLGLQGLQEPQEPLF